MSRPLHPSVKPLNPHVFATRASLRLQVAALIKRFEEFKFEAEDDEAATICVEAVEQLDLLLEKLRVLPADKPSDAKTVLTETEHLTAMVDEHAKAYLTVIARLEEIKKPVA